MPVSPLDYPIAHGLISRHATNYLQSLLLHLTRHSLLGFSLPQALLRLLRLFGYPTECLPDLVSKLNPASSFRLLVHPTVTYLVRSRILSLISLMVVPGSTSSSWSSPLNLYSWSERWAIVACIDVTLTLRQLSACFRVVGDLTRAASVFTPKVEFKCAGELNQSAKLRKRTIDRPHYTRSGNSM